MNERGMSRGEDVGRDASEAAGMGRPAPEARSVPEDAAARRERETAETAELAIALMLRSGYIDESVAAELRAMPVEERFRRSRSMKERETREQASEFMLRDLLARGVIDQAGADEINALPADIRASKLMHAKVAADYPNMSAAAIDDLFGKVPEPKPRSGWDKLKGFFGFETSP